MELDFKVYDPEPSELARKLASQYGYRPYMIERYISMFGKEETLEYLLSNESFSMLSLRVNTLKSDPKSVYDALQLKGYKLNQSEIIPYAYSIVQNQEKMSTNKPNPHIINLDDYQVQGFERDPSELKQIQWGEPSYMNEDYQAAVKQEQEVKTALKSRGKSIATLGSTHEYLMGKYYIQDIASMLPPFYLNPQPNELVLDMCAAPGGKTTHLAQIMENQGHLFALEVDKKRIRSLIYNLRRCGVQNTSVLQMDANSIHKESITPDKILLDAPCTGEGLIRNDPTRKTSKSITEITGMMRKQFSLLQSAIKAVKPGGQIMYSTCSIAPEENEFVVQKALDSFPNIEIATFEDDWGFPGYITVFGESLSGELLKARRLFPHIHNTIGFFYCLLHKLK